MKALHCKVVFKNVWTSYFDSCNKEIKWYELKYWLRGIEMKKYMERLGKISATKFFKEPIL